MAAQNGLLFYITDQLNSNTGLICFKRQHKHQRETNVSKLNRGKRNSREKKNISTVKVTRFLNEETRNPRLKKFKKRNKIKLTFLFIKICQKLSFNPEGVLSSQNGLKSLLFGSDFLQLFLLNYVFIIIIVTINIMFIQHYNVNCTLLFELFVILSILPYFPSVV